VTYEIRTATEDDWNEIFQLLADAFNDTFDEAARDDEKQVWEPDRSTVAELDGKIVGHAAAFTRDLAVPGAVVPAAHVTMVSVGATHRRQGLLTRMIADQHAQSAARDEPIAVLWASEGRIYQRFGYGLAAERSGLEAVSGSVAWRVPLDTTGGRIVEVPANAPDAFRDVYEAAWRSYPGWSSRDDNWWAFALNDVPAHRNGATPMRAVVHYDAAGQADGYLRWRVKSDWGSAGPNGSLNIQELTTLTPEAYQALWQFALSFDLTRNVRYWFSRADEPIRLMVTEPRTFVTTVSDSLWVRVLDVPAALSARRYAAPIDVVLEVTDARVAANNGRWHLVGSPDHAICKPTDEPADVMLDVHELGAAYLGGTSLTTLATAGAVRELRENTLAAMSVAFTWHRKPAAIEMF
jgi:predicted acetyltransferase